MAKSSCSQSHTHTLPAARYSTPLTATGCERKTGVCVRRGRDRRK